MQSSNPVLGKAFNQPNTSTNQDSFQQLEKTFSAPAASSMRTGRMTIEDVVAKTGFLFGILVVVGAVAIVVEIDDEGEGEGDGEEAEAEAEEERGKWGGRGDVEK